MSSLNRRDRILSDHGYEVEHNRTGLADIMSRRELQLYDGNWTEGSSKNLRNASWVAKIASCWTESCLRLGLQRVLSKVHTWHNAAAENCDSARLGKGTEIGSRRKIGIGIGIRIARTKHIAATVWVLLRSQDSSQYLAIARISNIIWNQFYLILYLRTPFYLLNRIKLSKNKKKCRIMESRQESNARQITRRKQQRRYRPEPVTSAVSLFPLSH